MDTLTELFAGGADLSFIIVATGGVGAALLLERMVALGVLVQVDAARPFRRVQVRVLSGDIGAARRVCLGAKRAAVPRVIAAGLLHAHRSEAEIAVQVDESRLELIPAISRRIGLIPKLANISMLLGLLGTVLGMICGFHTPMSRCIPLALGSTALGLLVGIPLLAGHLFVSGLATNLLAEVELYAARTQRLLAAWREGRLVPRVDPFRGCSPALD